MLSKQLQNIIIEQCDMDEIPKFKLTILNISKNLGICICEPNVH